MRKEYGVRGKMMMTRKTEERGEKPVTVHKD
jgi:hypothetical protein